MKSVKRVLLIMLVIVIPAILTAQEKDKNTETVKFKTSIFCNNCVNKIMTNLPQEKGVKDVKCDLGTKEVSVTYQKDKNNPAEIKKAIEKLGYTAKEVTPETAAVKKDK
jgi:copper chaperone CopZ